MVEPLLRATKYGAFLDPSRRAHRLLLGPRRRRSDWRAAV